MSISAHNPYDEPESSTTKWVAIFILLSLLVHAVLIAVILLISLFVPVPKMAPPEPANPIVSLSLLPPVPATPNKPLFVPTNPDPNAKHKLQQVESANDHELTSQSKIARKPDSIMPDVNGKDHAPDLADSPNVRAPETPQPSTTPPTPKQAKPEKPTPPQPKPQQARQNPAQPGPKPAPPTPPKKASPQVDANGFPILPPLNVATMAPPDSAAQPLAPAPSQQQQAASVHGALGRQGDNSPAAMATALGKYKQKVYSAVGSRWYPKVDNSFQVLGVGIVHVQFTIHSDGSVETKVLDGGDGSTQMLLSISINSIREAAPFDPFPPEMVKELISQQGGDGSSYTDDFSFSIYGR